MRYRPNSIEMLYFSATGLENAMVVPLVFTLKSCPKCHSKIVRRSSRRNKLEDAIGVLALPWRCETCDLRFFVFRKRRCLAHSAAGSK
jgi:hypothetical protein